MNIVMLNGQDHKGSSYHIGRMIIDKIEGAKTVTEFFFPRDLDHFCRGCYSCIEDAAKCPFYGEKQRIIDAMDEADVIVVTSPTYCLNMSAPLKAFFDLTFDIWMTHRPLKTMFSKRAVIVSTSAGASTKATTKAISKALFYMGIPSVTRYGLAVQAMNWEGVSPEKKAKIEKAAAKISGKLSSVSRPRVGLKTRATFFMMSLMQKKGWNSSPVETEYWRSNGWLDGGRPWNGRKG